MAVLLVIGFVEWIQEPDFGVADMLGLFAMELGIGALAGIAVGWLAVKGLRRARLDTPGLYPVATLATAAVAFGAADFLHGSGFLAAYLAGLALGSAAIPAKRTVTVFHEGLGWVAQITMFLVARPARVPQRARRRLARGHRAHARAAVRGAPAGDLRRHGARPLLDRRSASVLGWAGLRGAVPVVLATFPVIDGVAVAGEFFNIVFFAVVISTLLQGVTFEPLAERLGVTTNEPALPRPLAETGTIRRLGAEIARVPGGARRRRGRPPRAGAGPAARRAPHGDRARRARPCCRAAPRAWRRATGCTWWCAARWRTEWRACSSAGARGRW